MTINDIMVLCGAVVILIVLLIAKRLYDNNQIAVGLKLAPKMCDGEKNIYLAWLK